MDYLELKERQRKELEAFPMFFAFSDKQFNEGMNSLGLDPEETDKIYKFGNTGGFYRKTDAAALHEMFDRHERERQEAIESDTSGEGYIYQMFSYELANHEYIITYNKADTLRAVGLTQEEINENPALLHGLKMALAEY